MAQRQVKYDHDHMIRGENGMNRLSPGAVQERLVWGDEMNQAYKKIFDKCIAAGGFTEPEAKRLAREERDKIAQQYNITDKYIQDFTAIAARFGSERWDQEEIKKAPWKILQVFSAKKIPIEYADAIVQLIIHGQEHPGCPNSIAGPVLELEKRYAQQIQQSEPEVMGKLAALQLEKSLPLSEDQIEQAQRHEEHTTLQTILKHIPTPLQMQELHKKINEQSAKIEELQEENLDLDTENDRLRDSVTAYENEAKDAAQRIQELVKIQNEQNEQLVSLNLNFNKAIIALDDLTHKQASAITAAVKEVKDDYGQRLDEARKNTQQQRDRVLQLEANIIERHTELATAQLRITRLESEVEDLRKQPDIERENTDLLQQLSEEKIIAYNLQKRNALLTVQIQAMQDAVARLQLYCDVLKQTSGMEAEKVKSEIKEKILKLFE